jgi:hypothetical protein
MEVYDVPQGDNAIELSIDNCQLPIVNVLLCHI